MCWQFLQIFIDVEINTHIQRAELKLLVSTYLKNKYFSDVLSIIELSLISNRMREKNEGIFGKEKSVRGENGKRERKKAQKIKTN